MEAEVEPIAGKQQEHEKETEKNTLISSFCLGHISLFFSTGFVFFAQIFLLYSFCSILQSSASSVQPHKLISVNS